MTATRERSDVSITTKPAAGLPMKSRHLWVLVHRWGGLLLAVPLIIVALTGSIIAFTHEVNHLLTPRYYASLQPSVPRLDIGELAARAEALISPRETVLSLIVRPNQVTARSIHLAFLHRRSG